MRAARDLCRNPSRCSLLCPLSEAKELWGENGCFCAWIPCMIWIGAGACTHAPPLTHSLCLARSPRLCSHPPTHAARTSLDHSLTLPLIVATVTQVLRESLHDACNFDSLCSPPAEKTTGAATQPRKQQSSSAPKAEGTAGGDEPTVWDVLRLAGEVMGLYDHV